MVIAVPPFICNVLPEVTVLTVESSPVILKLKCPAVTEAIELSTSVFVYASVIP